MKVYDLEDFSEWAEISDKCDYATFFHTPEWYSVFSNTYSYMEIKTKKMVFSDGKVAILPLMEESTSRYQKKYVSSPAGVYGGWLTNNNVQPNQISELVKWILESLKNIHLRINPLVEHYELLNSYSTKEDSTELLYLDNFKNEDSLKANYKYSVRKQINKALKKKFCTKIATNWQEWEKYYELYRKALVKWGEKASSRYPLELFRNFYQLHSSKIKLWLLLNEDKIIGGNLNFYHNKHCVEWHAAFDEEFLKFGSRNFLVHHIIYDTLLNGFKYYDFNPSGGHQGTLRFKKTFGTTSRSSNVIYRIDNSIIPSMIRKVIKVKNDLKKIFSN